MSLEFQDQVVLVTGGGTGIGRATSLLFAKHGAKVAVNYSRSVNEAESTVDTIRQLGGEAIAIQADVSCESDVARMMESVRGQFGRLDVLVNSAATTFMVPYQDLDAMTADKWHQIMSVNLLGTFWVCKAAMPLLRANENGQIVNVSSISGITGMGSCLAYAASKAAVISLTKGLAVSQAPHVRVNAVAPGVVQTRWIEGWESFTEPHRDATPLQRLAQPDDIAAAIYSLAINRFVTGQVMVVDGGRMLAS